MKTRPHRLRFMSQFLLADGAGYKRVARPVLASDHRKATTSLARAAASILERYGRPATRRAITSGVIAPRTGILTDDSLF